MRPSPVVATTTLRPAPVSETPPVVPAFRDHLRDWRFWVVQGLVLLATSLHWWLEAFEFHRVNGLYVDVMDVAYLVPVIYASLNFGRAGAIPTAIWSALLATPNILIWHHGLDRVVEGGQIFTVITLAVVISSRVDREVAARHRAELEEIARRASEARYRGLFAGAGEAILVFDGTGIVQEANAAAGELFGRPVAAMRGLPLGVLVGAENALRLRQIATGHEVVSDDLRLATEDGGERWVAAVCGVVAGPAGATVVQALLRDVTERRARQRGLETYARRIVQAQEEERRRIARELHDSSLQAVVLLCRRLDALETTSDNLSPSLRQALSDTRQSAESIADELRRFSRDLRPSILDDLGLAPAVRWLVAELERRSDVRGKLMLVGQEQRLSSDAELCLFRIAQEALRNVERHAAASSVVVTLSYQQAHMRLTIQDDGKGLPAARMPPVSVAGEKLGLLGIQERARLLGGNVQVTSRPNRGTRVRVTLPLPATPPGDQHGTCTSPGLGGYSPAQS